MPKVARKRKPTRRKIKKQPLIVRLIKLILSLVQKPIILLPLAIIILATWFYYSGQYQTTTKTINNKINNISTQQGLIIKDILLEGQYHTPKEDILEAITGQRIISIGDPIINIDLWKIKERLEKLTWVKHASVERQYPSTLGVSIIERTPIGLWQNNNKVYLIDDEGKIIRTKQIENFSDLIILVGQDAPSNTEALLSMMQTEPEIYEKVSSAIRISKRRWNIRLHNGIEIKLPEEEPSKAWEYITEQHKQNNILDSDIKMVDLRIESKMFVK